MSSVTQDTSHKMKPFFFLLIALFSSISFAEMSDAEANKEAQDILASWDGVSEINIPYDNKKVYDQLSSYPNVHLVDDNGNELIASRINSGVNNAAAYYNKAKSWMQDHIPAWQEIGFLVNVVSVYQKLYDNYENFMYQVRLIQQTIHLVERQYYWIQRTAGMIQNMGQRGYSLADIEKNFRDASYLTGPHYRYLCYMTSRTLQNMDDFNAAFGNYSWASKEEKGYATYSVYLGNPAIRGAAFLDPNDKRPLIMKANLASATEADAMISSFNESLDDIVKQKKDLNDAITESSQQNASTQVGDINQSKTYQMIVLANVLRARSKLYTIDALKERNRLMAMRVLSLSQRNREGVFEKYKQAAIINE